MTTLPKCKEMELVTLYPGRPTFMKTTPKSKEQKRFEKERLELKRQHHLKILRLKREKRDREEFERLELLRLEKEKQDREEFEHLKLLHIKKEKAPMFGFSPTKTTTPAHTMAQLITDNNSFVASLQPVKKIGESLPTYSANVASMYFGFNLHLDQHLPMGKLHGMEDTHEIGPDPPTTQLLTTSDLEPNPHHSPVSHTLTMSDLKPDPHHSKSIPPVLPTPTTSDLKPDLPHSEISFVNSNVPNDFNDYKDPADYDTDVYSSDDDDFSDDDDYDNY